MKVKVYSYFDRPEQAATDPGSRYEPVFEMIINDKGVKELKKTGDTNLWEMIQSYKDDCIVSNILAKAVIDPTVLNQRQGFYADITTMPHSLAEAQQMIMKIKNDFNTLPPEERAKFNYSAEQYIAEFGSKEWAEKVGISQEEQQAIKAATEAAAPQAEKKEGDVNESK